VVHAQKYVYTQVSKLYTFYYYTRCTVSTVLSDYPDPGTGQEADKQYKPSEFLGLCLHIYYRHYGGSTMHNIAGTYPDILLSAPPNHQSAVGTPYKDLLAYSDQECASLYGNNGLFP
jgi:hypothetical protein